MIPPYVDALASTYLATQLPQGRFNYLLGEGLLVLGVDAASPSQEDTQKVIELLPQQ
jgi:hypothetical protein